MTHANTTAYWKNVCLLAAIICAWTLTAPAQYRPPVLDPNARPADRILEIQREIGIDQKLDAQVPLDLVFRNEQGKEVVLRDYFKKGKPVILNLVYFQCPMLCGQVLNGLLKSLARVEWSPGKEFEILTISFDPTEKPELAAQKKTNYLKQFKREGAAEGWHWLTGEPEPIKKLTQAVGFRYKYDQHLKQYAHAAGIIILTPEGKVSRYLYGIEYLARDVKMGLTEASKGKIGGPVEKIMLLCYHYDPSLGKYSLFTLRLLRVAGVITLLSVGSFVGLMIRRDIKRGRKEAGENQPEAESQPPSPEGTD